MAARIPSRYGISIPEDIKNEMSDNSLAKNCFVKQGFSRALQEYLVDYSLSVNSPLVMTDYPYNQDWRDRDVLPASIQPVPVDNPKEVVKEEQKVTPTPVGATSSTVTQQPTPRDQTNEIVSPKTTTYLRVPSLKRNTPTDLLEVTERRDESGKIVTTEKVIKTFSPEETNAEIDRAYKAKMFMRSNQTGPNPYGSVLEFGRELGDY